MRRLYPSDAFVANPANSLEMPARRHNCRADNVIGRTAIAELARGARVGIILEMAKGSGLLTASEDLFARVIL